MMGKRSNSFANNVLIFLLAFSMILCQIPVDAFAESGTLVLKINDADMTLSAAGDFSGAKKVKYGDSMALTLEPSSGYSGDANFCTLQEIVFRMILLPGEYGLRTNILQNRGIIIWAIRSALMVKLSIKQTAHTDSLLKRPSWPRLPVQHGAEAAKLRGVL